MEFEYCNLVPGAHLNLSVVVRTEQDTRPLTQGQAASTSRTTNLYPQVCFATGSNFRRLFK